MRKLSSEGSLKVIFVSWWSQDGSWSGGSGTPVMESGDGAKTCDGEAALGGNVVSSTSSTVIMSPVVVSIVEEGGKGVVGAGHCVLGS